MTRKRFVKLLMAEGYSRNDANDIADEVLEDGFSYAEAYDHITRMLPLVQAILPAVSDVVHQAAETIGRLAGAVCEAASAAVKAFTAAMSQT